MESHWDLPLDLSRPHVLHGRKSALERLKEKLWAVFLSEVCQTSALSLGDLRIEWSQWQCGFQF
jgi:hypothetical protein